jgi:phospholipid/cholesterol/gamma-HCH transport system substrate-binding protein
MASVLGRQKYRALGVAFLALILIALYLVYAAFTQKFSHFDKVTLQTDTIGLQLPDRADVKIRGVLVGQVLDFKATARGAEVTLGIKPSDIDIIPANVTGAILPKTLFGEKYVALDVPAQPAAQHLRSGAVITKTAVSTEVEQVLSDVYPLLQSIQPAQLNTTLNALATALDGRGEQLGQTLTTLDAYLKKINPQLPLFVDDLQQTAKVATTYNDVLPQVADILRNTITTATTLQDRSTQLHDLLTNVTSFSTTADAFLAANGDNLIQLGQVSEPTVGTLARYAPEFPCLLGGMDNLGKRVSSAFRNYTLHIDLITLPRQPRGYTAKDAPTFNEDRGPACGHLPNPPWSATKPLKLVPNLSDGVNTPTGKGTDRSALGFDSASTDSTGSTSTGALGYAGSPAETEVLDTLLAPVLGTTAADVPDLGGLLVGPMARGAKVSLE